MAPKYRQLELDRQLCFALYSASRAVTRAYTPMLDGLGLTYPQYVTMLALWETPDESVSVGDLGARLHLDSGTLTPLLKRLEWLGFVKRMRDASDERRVLVKLTDAGLQLRDAAESVPGELLRKANLGAGDVAALREQLQRLTEALERA